MIRTFDATRLTEIANSAEVRPLLGGNGEIDLSPVVGDFGNFTFVNDAGGIILTRLYGDDFSSTYEAHSIFRHRSPPRRVAGLMARVIDYMFLSTDCAEILTKVADNNPGAKWLAGRGNFEEKYHRGSAWAPGVGVSYMKLALDRWASLCSTALEQGQAFHVLLETAKRAEGSGLPVHSEDAAHDRAVGAAIMMMKSGNVVKGLNFYNKWASFAGYGAIRLISEQPVVVDTVDAIMGLTDGHLEVLQCR